MQFNHWQYPEKCFIHPIFWKLAAETISLDIDQENSSTSTTATTDSGSDSIASLSTDEDIIPPDNASIENDDQGNTFY